MSWLAGTHQISEFSRDIAVYQVKLATFVCFQHSWSVGEGLNELQNKRRSEDVRLSGGPRRNASRPACLSSQFQRHYSAQEPASGSFLFQ